MKTVSEFAADLARIIPVGAAEGIGVVELVAAITDVLRGDSERESFADGFR